MARTVLLNGILILCWMLISVFIGWTAGICYYSYMHKTSSSVSSSAASSSSPETFPAWTETPDASAARMRRSARMLISDDDLSSPWHSSAQVQQQQQQQHLVEYLVHPTMLAHEAPKSIALVVVPADDYQDEYSPNLYSYTVVDLILNEMQVHSTIVESIVIVEIESPTATTNTTTNKNSIQEKHQFQQELSQTFKSLYEIDLTWLVAPDIYHLPQIVLEAETIPIHQSHKFKKFDVILMHNVVPSYEVDDDVDVDDAMKNDEKKQNDIPGLGALDDDGMMAIGFAPKVSTKDRMEFLQYLAGSDIDESDSGATDDHFEFVMEYQMRQSYAVALKSRSSKAQWHQTESLWMHRWLLRLRDKGDIQQELAANLRDFSLVADPSFMTYLEFPSKLTERDFCHAFPESCSDQHGLDPFTPNIPQSDLVVAKSGMGDHAGRGIFAGVDIPANAYLAVETNCRPVRVHWKTMKWIWAYLSQHDIYRELGYILEYYIDGYGFIDEPWGVSEWTVEASVLTFVNHGCNSTYNMGVATPLNEWTVDLDAPPLLEVAYHDFDAYNPLEERDMTKLQWIAKTSKPVPKDKELLENYMALSGALDFFVSNVKQLRRECAGLAGAIEKYETVIRPETTHDSSGITAEL